eukprot:3462576-Pyramimonas_sp.AAC.2
MHACLPTAGMIKRPKEPSALSALPEGVSACTASASSAGGIAWCSTLKRPGSSSTVHLKSSRPSNAARTCDMVVTISAIGWS